MPITTSITLDQFPDILDAIREIVPQKGIDSIEVSKAVYSYIDDLLGNNPTNKLLRKLRGGLPHITGTLRKEIQGKINTHLNQNSNS